MKRLTLFMTCLSAVLLACDSPITSPPPRLKGPTDIVQAGAPLASGTGGKHLFVFGGRKNLVYVLDAETNGFVRAPNLYFPLEIKVCDYPSAGAATSDGRFVFVGCAGEDGAYVLDALTFKLVRDAAGDPMRIALGSGASQMLRGLAKTTTGADRFYTLNTYSQTITVFDVTTAADQAAPTVTPQPDITNTGSIVRGVLTSTYLYAADSTSPFVRRIELSTGARNDFDVGVPSVDVALARNGGKLYVVTPSLQGLTVLDTLSGQRVDTRPVYAPQLPDDRDYESIYIGELPARVLVLDDEDTALTVQCKAGDGTTSAVSSFALVITEGGSIVFLDATRDRVIDELSCVGPAVTSSTGDTELFNTVFPFTDCKNTVTRARTVCAGNSGVVLFPGFTPASRWQLAWEPIIPNADRSGGGGTFVSETKLTDVGLDLSSLGLRADDRFLLVTPTKADAACIEKYGEKGSAARELTITDVQIEDDKSVITFAPAIDVTCFDTAPGTVQYQLRYGNSFLVLGASIASGASPSPLVRLGLGETFGADNDQAIRFTINPALQPERDQVYDFVVTPNFQLLATGKITDTSGAITAVGRVPTAIVVLPPATNGTRIGRGYVAFGANDAIISFAAFDSRLLGSDQTLLIR